MRGFAERADVEDVERFLGSNTVPLEAEVVALADVVGRVLAGDVSAAAPVPSFARSAMDGFALRGEDSFGASDYDPIAFDVIGIALPGRAFEGRIAKGAAVRIMTGAPLPEGADAVVMAEVASEREGRVFVREPVAPRKNVGAIGEDVKAGDVVLRAGRRLRPQDAGLLAAIGVASARCLRRPRVALIITGDELLPAGSVPSGHRIVDSNSVVLRALVLRDGGVVLPFEILPDQPERIREALANANADVVLVSGGSSVGQEDHAPRLVAELGSLDFHGIAMRPSSPAGIGRIPHGAPLPRSEPEASGEVTKMLPRSEPEASGEVHKARVRPSTEPQNPIVPRSEPQASGDVHQAWVFLLPGNPVSCLCAYEFFAGPTIRALGGRSRAWPHRRVRVPLARKISSQVGRVDYVRVAIEAGRAVPLATSGAAILSSTVRADGCVLVPRSLEGMPEGTEVEVLLYDEDASS
jgi:molybdopterin molybdotransferase